ncbi:hypothetical protein C9374_000330 [Naegleria lovaniensis]|uniref:Uncharacterized protein n=1 Tax=Naegleria lovaniensis TaxID=51637 RepID=A0AA88GUZ3_NAELO|nr:uncharacterized protein C9374_000330 [Naegleria lovaniensis]KAG2388891.1 hypothetical protein C9374_000330 [Naegleria lovaniensis]
MLSSSSSDQNGTHDMILDQIRNGFQMKQDEQVLDLIVEFINTPKCSLDHLESLIHFLEMIMKRGLKSAVLKQFNYCRDVKLLRKTNHQQPFRPYDKRSNICTILIQFYLLLFTSTEPPSEALIHEFTTFIMESQCKKPCPLKDHVFVNYMLGLIHFKQIDNVVIGNDDQYFVVTDRDSEICQHHRLALAYFNKAISIQHNHAPSLFYLSLFHRSGTPFVNYVKWEQFLQLSADLGFAEAQYGVAKVYEKNNALQRSFTFNHMKMVVHYYSLAAAQCHAPSLYELGKIYHDGKILGGDRMRVEKDLLKAFHYYAQAAEMGYVKALVEMACAFRDGNHEANISQNVSKALWYFGRAAQLGNEESRRQYELLKRAKFMDGFQTILFQYCVGEKDNFFDFRDVTIVVHDMIQENSSPLYSFQLLTDELSKLA